MSAPPVRAEEAPATPVIGTILIQPLNVFSPEEAARGWVYRLANSLRFSTRESTIREFLLFKEGDPYNATRIEETERNLRALPFLKSATITVSPPHDGKVDVDVVTQDSWTTEPGISVGSKGGTTTYSFGLKEKDFLGYGTSKQSIFAGAWLMPRRSSGRFARWSTAIPTCSATTGTAS